MPAQSGRLWDNCVKGAAVVALALSFAQVPVVSAILFALAAIDLLLLQRELRPGDARVRSSLGFGLAALIALSGVLLAASDGIDVPPLNTSIAFTLLGLGFLTLNIKTKNDRRPAHVFFVLVILMSLGVFMGRIFGATELYAFPGALRSGAMSSMAAIAFLSLSAGGLLSRRDCGPMRVITASNVSGLVARRMLVAAILIPVFIGAVVLEGAIQGYYPYSFAFTLLTIISVTMLAYATVHTSGISFASEQERGLREREQKFLADANCVMTQSLDSAEVLSRMARFTVPAVADWCTVVVPSQYGNPQRVLIVHSDPGKQKWAEHFLSKYPVATTHEHGPGYVLRTGLAEVILKTTNEFVQQIARDSRMYRLILKIGLNSYACLPIKTRGRVYGTISFITTRESGRYLCERDIKMLQSLAERTALAIENALLYEEAKKAVRLRADLLAFASHDLKNPLSGILMSTRLLEKGIASTTIEPERLIKLVKNIAKSAERMGRLIRDLLDLTKIEAGRLTVAAGECDARSLVNETAEMFATIAGQNRLLLKVDLDQNATVVTCDRERIMQVFSNLVGNAIKFTRPGGVITIGARQGASELVFWVSDTGTGIPSENLPRIFERYWQEQKTAHKGTGLGLAITKGIVEAHGGRIWVESKVGEGSKFLFTLPSPEKKSASFAA